MRYQNLSATGVEVKVEEDTYSDSEVNHTTEVVHYLAIDQGADTLTGWAW